MRNCSKNTFTMSDREKEISILLNKRNQLKRTLLMYARRYEEVSTCRILINKIWKKSSAPESKTAIAPKKKLKINKTENPLDVTTLCCIFNYNESKNAEILLSLASEHFDTIVMDSGSKKRPSNAINYKNIYYSGLLNNAHNIAKEKGYKYLFIICSDVTIGKHEMQAIRNNIAGLNLSEIAVYAPSSQGSTYEFCKRQPGSSLRAVPFVEGYIFFCATSVLDYFCPVNVQENKLGWGLDLATGYYAGNSGFLCVIDDEIEVSHAKGSGYSRELALLEMEFWIESKNDPGLKYFLHKNTIFSE